MGYDAVFFRNALVEVDVMAVSHHSWYPARIRQRTDHSWSSMVLCCHLYSRPSDALNFRERWLYAKKPCVSHQGPHVPGNGTQKNAHPPKRAVLRR